MKKNKHEKKEAAPNVKAPQPKKPVVPNPEEDGGKAGSPRENEEEESETTAEFTQVPEPVTQKEVDNSEQPKAPAGPIDNGEEAP